MIALTVSGQLLVAVSGQIPMTVSTPTTRPPAQPLGLASDPGLWVPAEEFGELNAHRRAEPRCVRVLLNQRVA